MAPRRSLHLLIAFALMAGVYSNLWAKDGLMPQKHLELFSLSNISKLIDGQDLEELSKRLNTLDKEHLFSPQFTAMLQWDRVKSKSKEGFESLEQLFLRLDPKSAIHLKRQVHELFMEQLQLYEHLKSTLTTDELKEKVILDRRGLLNLFQKEISEAKIRRWVEVDAFIKKNPAFSLEIQGRDILSQRFDNSVQLIRSHLQHFPRETEARFIEDAHAYLSSVFDQIRSREHLDQVVDEVEGLRRQTLALVSRNFWSLLNFNRDNKNQPPLLSSILESYQRLTRHEGIFKEDRAFTLAQKMVALSPSTTTFLPKGQLGKQLNENSPFMVQVARQPALNTYIERMSTDERTNFLGLLHDHIAFSILEKEGRLNPWQYRGGFSLFHDDNIARLPDGITLVSGRDGTGVQLKGRVTHQRQTVENRQWVFDGSLNALEYLTGGLNTLEYINLGITASRRLRKTSASALDFNPSVSIQELIMAPSTGSSKTPASTTLTGRLSFVPQGKDWLKSWFSKIYSFPVAAMDLSFYHGDHHRDILGDTKNSISPNFSWYFMGLRPDQSRWLLSERIQFQESQSSAYKFWSAKTSLSYHRPSTTWDLDVHLIYTMKNYSDYYGLDRHDHNLKSTVIGKYHWKPRLDMSLQLDYESQNSKVNSFDYNRVIVTGGIEKVF